MPTPLQGDIGTFLENVTSVPARFHILNLNTDECIYAQLNPTEFTDEVGAEWEKLSTPGQSHQRMHFRNTSNYTVSMDLRFRAYSEAEYTEMNRAKHHLLSWCYPVARASRSGGPPRLLATWPGVFSIECFLTKVSFKNERFLKSGAVVGWTASAVFEEARDKLVTSDQIAVEVIVRGAEIDDFVDAAVAPPEALQPRKKPPRRTTPTLAEYEAEDQRILESMETYPPDKAAIARPYVAAAGRLFQTPAGQARTEELTRLASEQSVAIAPNSSDGGIGGPNSSSQNSSEPAPDPDGPNSSEPDPDGPNSSEPDPDTDPNPSGG